MAAFFCGCASPLPAARRLVVAGHPERAVEKLNEATVPERDQVLLFMERGAVRQALGQYEQSSRDFIAAADLIEQMETRSLAHGAAGTVTSDRALRFSGVPFERTLLHALTAINHLALGHWDLAAVESRRILKTLDPERRDDYPEDAFSRYVAGFGFQMIGDRSNAAMQFRHADEQVDSVSIDEDGRLQKAPPHPGDEVVVFILYGLSPSGKEVQRRRALPYVPTHAEMYAGDRLLGSAYVLADTADLAFETANRQAAKKTARALARVAAKEAAARSIDRENGFLGFLFRVILIDLFEQPDVRRWELMPRRILVARLPCAAPVNALRMVLCFSGGGVREIEVNGPFSQRGLTRVAVVRVLP